MATNAGASNAAKGRVTWAAVTGLLSLVGSTLRQAVARRPRVAYLYLSQNRSGFVRDAALACCCFVCGVPVVAHVHGSNFGNFLAAAPPALATFVRFVVHRLAGVILLAERFRVQFDGLLPTERITVVYNCIDHSPFVENARRPRAAGPLTVLSVGHLSVAKGFGDILAAIPEVLERHPEIVFEFAGEWLLAERNILRDEQGAELPQQDLQTRWRELAARFPANVRLLGTITGARKLEAFRRADIFLFASYSEGFPMAVLEAMASGLPLITTPAGALAEVLTDGVNGRLVQAGDSVAIAEAVCRLAEDHGARTRMGHRNQMDVVRRFSPDICMPAIAAALDRSVVV